MSTYCLCGNADEDLNLTFTGPKSEVSEDMFLQWLLWRLIFGIVRLWLFRRTSEVVREVEEEESEPY